MSSQFDHTIDGRRRRKPMHFEFIVSSEARTFAHQFIQTSTEPIVILDMARPSASSSTRLTSGKGAVPIDVLRRRSTLTHDSARVRGIEVNERRLCCLLCDMNGVDENGNAKMRRVKAERCTRPAALSFPKERHETSGETTPHLRLLASRPFHLHSFFAHAPFTNEISESLERKHRGSADVSAVCSTCRFYLTEKRKEA